MNYTLKIAWLYPDLMSTYGDRGNIIVLTKRCQWRNIGVEVKRINPETDHKLLATCDLLFMGGAQDKQQEIVNKDLLENKGKYLREAIEMGIPSLFICGAYQFMGKYYKTAEGTIINGLSIFDLYTINPGEKHKRLIGNIIIDMNNDLRLKIKDHTETKNIHKSSIINHKSYIVGFENHGGRTYLGKDVKPFGQVLHGFGNNGEDRTEGMVYKNSIGTYLHGPILPKNPEIADWLIKKALEVKYKKDIQLEEIDSTLEQKAKDVIVKRYNLKI